MDNFPFDVAMPAIVVIGVLLTLGWVATTWLRMRHGYPLESAWGTPIYPKTDQEAKARIQLLTQENAKLQAELSSMKDRLATVERIVTDEGFDVARQIDALRDSSDAEMTKQ
ncbi:hypothetical protein GCM10011371_13430 [Novosphingobium marinum]|uniref:Putative metal-binding membrane protein n=1 Tax=Novosphingobium marinum TaxID=1514948 RepID=A0A7Z0BT01_9SPHN|nr:hypothetical protein [Novosphingobium marinum]NYH95451.1 putative metal-binding membrane protein [Novosphingobium marinum]GGC27170.1 hypothetical protein GCM10011371_13430 [Novosphingobium marinum]